jgi:hypothetical protein
LEAVGHIEERRIRPCRPPEGVEQDRPPFAAQCQVILLVLIHAAALKNAEDLLQDVMKAVDTNGDGKIQYEGMLLALINSSIRLLCIIDDAN